MTNPHSVFKPYIVRRPGHECQVLFPLSELDALVSSVQHASHDLLQTEYDLLALDYLELSEDARILRRRLEERTS